jgi:hypothetical protein
MKIIVLNHANSKVGGLMNCPWIIDLPPEPRS